MKIDAENDEIVFADGTRMYANRGILGLAPYGQVTYGYDGSLPTLSPAQKLELAVYMVEIWRKFGGID